MVADLCASSPCFNVIAASDQARISCLLAVISVTLDHNKNEDYEGGYVETFNRNSRLFLAVLLSIPALAQTRALVTEEMMVKTADAGIEIYVRNKRPADMTSIRPEQTVLYVHGATYPSETAFDLKLDGMSWMEYIAARGYDVWLLDLRGYGKSARPSEMADKPDANPPIVTGQAAVKDIGTAVDFILQRRNIPRLNLLGWSWGTTLMATYTTQNAAKVERLVLYAPSWIRQTASLVQAGLRSRPQRRRAGRRRILWCRKPYYDPSKITVPTLLVGAEWDCDTPPYMVQNPVSAAGELTGKTLRGTG